MSGRISHHTPATSAGPTTPFGSKLSRTLLSGRQGPASRGSNRLTYARDRSGPRTQPLRRPLPQRRGARARAAVTLAWELLPDDAPAQSVEYSAPYESAAATFTGLLSGQTECSERTIVLPKGRTRAGLQAESRSPRTLDFAERLAQRFERAGGGGEPMSNAFQAQRRDALPASAGGSPPAAPTIRRA